MSLVDLITVNSVCSYAKACIEVARTCQRLGREGFRHTIVPSRGAAPIQSGASMYFHQIYRRAVSGEHTRTVLTEHLNSPLDSELYLPFTADSCAEMGDVSSNAVRSFWAKVVSAIVRGDLSDPHYRFFSFTRDSVCRVGFKSGIEDHVRSGKFIFLDTVVSGRAIMEIHQSFVAEGLNECHYLLIVDANGNKLNPQYRAQLTTLEQTGRATLLYVDSLFTEDQGPAVSGIWCVSCPELMLIAREEIPAFAAHGSIGAGIYYHEVRRRPDGTNKAVTVGMARLQTLISRAIMITACPQQLMEDLDAVGCLTEAYQLEWQQKRGEIYSRLFEAELAAYLDHILRYKLFDQSTTWQIASPKILDAANTKARLAVSSSHALRLHIDKDIAARLVREFRQTICN